MSLFLNFLLKLTPLYMSIFLGFVAGRYLHTPRDVVARIMFYLINPLVVFNGVLYTHIDKGILSLPLLIFFISCSLSLLFYWRTEKFWQDSTGNLLAFNAGTGNTGYFGLPIALMLFNTQGEGIYMMALMGVMLFENTLGFYIFAKGTHSPSECFWKLVKLPTLYAFVVALICNYFQISFPVVFSDFMCHIKGTYVVLGMMIIGLGLSSFHHFKLDWLYIGLAFFAKFVCWPAIMLAFIFLDAHWWGVFSIDVHRALMLLSIVPIGVNAVILATVLQANPEKAAAAVLLSTIFALFYIPLMIILFINGSESLLDTLYCPV